MTDIEREALARDIWKAGTTDPDSLATWLIRQGWGRRERTLSAGVQSGLKVTAEQDEMEGRLAELLCELTDGRMSGTGYDVKTMVQEVEAAFERDAQDAVTRAERAEAERDAFVKELRDRELHHFEAEKAMTEALAILNSIQRDPSPRRDEAIRILSAALTGTDTKEAADV